jgi:hypothetical protein
MKSRELQAEIDRLAEQFDVQPIPVGLRTNDGLNIYVDDEGTYHYAYWERGKLGDDRTGSLDDVLYWFCKGVFSERASYIDRRQTFLNGYQVLSQFDPKWGKRYVRDLAAFFHSISKPQDIALLPDIGEPL